MRKAVVLLTACLVAAVAGPAMGSPLPSLPPFDGTMTVEQVEPHVLRVLDDGAGHDLTDVDTFEDAKPASLLAAGDDGSVWMTSSGGFIEIGTPGEVPDPLDTFLARMEIGSDGTLWIADGYRGSSIGRWRDGAWTIYGLPSNAWVVWLDATQDGGLDFAWRDETALMFGAIQPGAEDWTATPPTSLPLVSPDGYVTVERTPNGRIWAAEGPWWQQGHRLEPGPLWISDGSAWQRVEPLADLPVQPRALVVEGPGTLRVSWLEVVPGTEKSGAWHATRHEQDGDWTVIPEAELGVTGSNMSWCSGYTRFDGQELTRYLDGMCLRPAAITPSGDVWVFGHDRNRRHPGVYVISPG